MSFRRLALSSLLWILFILFEVALLQYQYAIRGTSWHFLLHSLSGAGLGLAAAALYSAVRRQPVNPWLWAIVAQIISASPDFMFMLMRMPHELWMDVFLGHISIHTAPQPLPVALALFIVGGWAWYVTSSLGRIRIGVSLTVLTILLWLATMALHKPIPTTLEQYRSLYRDL